MRRFFLLLIVAMSSSLAFAENASVYVYNSCQIKLHVKSYPMDGSKGVDSALAQAQQVDVPLTNPYTAMVRVTDMHNHELFYTGIWAGHGIQAIEDRGQCCIFDKCIAE